MEYLERRAVASVLSEYLDIQYSVIGRSAEPHCLKWNDELILATPDLQVMAEHYIQIAEKNLIPITAMPRCAVGLATLPVIAHYHPDACIIWFDAHADLNTPGNLRIRISRWHGYCRGCRVMEVRAGETELI